MIIEKEDCVEETETTEYGTRYLSDGGYIRIGWLEIEVFNKQRELVRCINFQGMVISPTRGMIFRDRFFVILHVDCFFLVNLDTGSKIVYHFRVGGPIMFGEDHRRFYIFSDAETIEEREYNGISYEVKRKIVFPIGSKDNGKTLDFIHNPFDAGVVLVRMITWDDKLAVYSIELARSTEIKKLFVIPASETFDFKMATPSLLHMVGSSVVISYDFISKKIKKLSCHPGLAVSISPDGRYALSRYRDMLETAGVNTKLYGSFHDVSADGERLVSQINRRIPTVGCCFMKQTFKEIVLKSPLIYPVFTHVPMDKKWTRLMSDGSIETHGTWPLPGYSLDTPEEIRELGSEFAIPVVAWASRPPGVFTFEEAKRIYLCRLTKAIAKVLIK